jgi:hypothetical protein
VSVLELGSSQKRFNASILVQETLNLGVIQIQVVLSCKLPQVDLLLLVDLGIPLNRVMWVVCRE